MQNNSVHMYDIGDLKNDPDRLYHMAVCFSQFISGISPGDDGELATVFDSVNRSLWGNLPPVLVLDFRDPDDPNTWGNYGAPPAPTVGSCSADLPRLCSVADISALFGVSKSTVSRWFKRGLFPCVRIGGRQYAEYSDLITAIKQGKINQPDSLKIG